MFVCDRSDQAVSPHLVSNEFRDAEQSHCLDEEAPALSQNLRHDEFVRPLYVSFFPRSL